MNRPRQHKGRRSMARRSAGALAAAGALWLQAALAADAPPDAPLPMEPYPADRYQPLWQRSPFTIASVEAPVAASFADSYVLVGTGQIGGKPIVTILDRTTTRRFSLGQGEQGEGLELLELNPNADPLQVTAKLRKGAEQGTIRYDPALLKSGPAAAPAPMPGQPPPPPALPTQPGVVRPNTPNLPATPGATPVPRRRTVIIPSRPPGQ